MVNHKYTLVLIFLIVVSETFTFEHPGGLHTRKSIAFVKNKIDNREDPWFKSYSNLISKLKNKMQYKPQAIDCFSSTGAFKNGIIAVPARYKRPKGHEIAKKIITDDALTAYQFALAYVLTNSEDSLQRLRYSLKAKEIVLAWANNCKGFYKNDNGPLVLKYEAIALIFTAELLMYDNALSKPDINQINTFITRVLLRAAHEKISVNNNHGDWGTLLAMACYHFSNNKQGIVEETSRVKQKIDQNIEDSGRLSSEAHRNNHQGGHGISYTAFALIPMTAAAIIASNTGITNLFEYESPRGKTLEKALHYLFSFCQDNKWKDWPDWKLIFGTALDGNTASINLNSTTVVLSKKLPDNRPNTQIDDIERRNIIFYPRTKNETIYKIKDRHPRDGNKIILSKAAPVPFVNASFEIRAKFNVPHNKWVPGVLFHVMAEVYNNDQWKSWAHPFPFWENTGLIYVYPALFSNAYLDKP